MQVPLYKALNPFFAAPSRDRSQTCGLRKHISAFESPPFVTQMAHAFNVVVTIVQTGQFGRGELPAQWSDLQVDGDADLEPAVTEQEDEPEIDDEPEVDDHGGGNVEDEGENVESEDAAGCGSYGIDQSTGPLS
ncbi:MAG: hypothetical protein NVS3B5_20330 [Sphingomicrobium sp.]